MAVLKKVIPDTKAKNDDSDEKHPPISITVKLDSSEATQEDVDRINEGMRIALS